MVIKCGKEKSGYDAIVEAMEARSKDLYGDMIVTIKYWYDSQEIPSESTVILEDNNGVWEWVRDWWEGEENVELIGFCSVYRIRCTNVWEADSRGEKINI